MGICRCWRQHTAHLSALLSPVYEGTHKAAGFEWVLEHEKALKHFQAVVQAALPLGA